MFKNENQQKLLLNHVLCIVLILNPCVIAMMIVGVLIKVAKTLNHDGCDQIEAKKKNRKNTNHHTYVLMAIFAKSKPRPI